MRNVTDLDLFLTGFESVNAEFREAHGAFCGLLLLTFFVNQISSTASMFKLNIN